MACVPEGRWCPVALSRSASVCAVAVSGIAHLYDWSGAALRSVDVGGRVRDMQFTPCGKYLVVRTTHVLHQYDVVTTSCVRVMRHNSDTSFAISPCSRVVVVMQRDGVIATRHLYPHNSE